MIKYKCFECGCTVELEEGAEINNFLVGEMICHACYEDICSDTDETKDMEEQ